MIDRIYIIPPVVGEVAKFLMTFKDYPPSGTAGSFNLTKMQKQIEEASKGGK
jgi:arylsulfatase